MARRKKTKGRKEDGKKDKGQGKKKERMEVGKEVKR